MQRFPHRLGTPRMKRTPSCPTSRTDSEQGPPTKPTTIWRREKWKNEAKESRCFLTKRSHGSFLFAQKKAKMGRKFSSSRRRISRVIPVLERFPLVPTVKNLSGRSALELADDPVFGREVQEENGCRFHSGLGENLCQGTRETIIRQ